MDFSGASLSSLTTEPELCSDQLRTVFFLRLSVLIILEREEPVERVRAGRQKRPRFSFSDSFSTRWDVPMEHLIHMSFASSIPQLCFQNYIHHHALLLHIGNTADHGILSMMWPSLFWNLILDTPFFSTGERKEKRKRKGGEREREGRRGEGRRENESLFLLTPKPSWALFFTFSANL